MSKTNILELIASELIKVSSKSGGNLALHLDPVKKNLFDLFIKARNLDENETIKPQLIRDFVLDKVSQSSQPTDIDQATLNNLLSELEHCWDEWNFVMDNFKLTDLII